MTVMTAGAPSSRSTWLSLGLPGLAAVALYVPLFPAMIHEWVEFPSLSHGFAIPLIAAYLVWARRERLRTVPLEPSLWGLPVMVAGLGGLVVGVHGGEPFLARISFPVALLGLTLFLAGREITRQVWIGIGYLAFMVPLPWGTVKLVTYRSRIFDAAASAEALGWLGVPVYREGVFLHLPNIALEIADECSSIPALAALVALGVAYASLGRRPLGVRVALIVAALPFAIGSNIIRITTTGLGAYYIGLWTLKTAYHMFNGTVNFLMTFLLLLVLDGALTALARRWSR